MKIQIKKRIPLSLSLSFSFFFALKKREREKEREDSPFLIFSEFSKGPHWQNFNPLKLIKSEENRICVLKHKRDITANSY